MTEYEMEHKTKDYVRRAQNNYLSKFDRVTIRLPKGAAQKIKNTIGQSTNAYIVKLIVDDMKNNYGIDIME